MTPSLPAVTPPSQRTEPLSTLELKAALSALHRVLVELRSLADKRENPSLLASVLDSIEVLPTSLLRPAEFDDLFLPTLDALVVQEPRFRGIRDEFARQLNPGYYP